MRAGEISYEVYDSRCHYCGNCISGLMFMERWGRCGVFQKSSTSLTINTIDDINQHICHIQLLEIMYTNSTHIIYSHG